MALRKTISFETNAQCVGNFGCYVGNVLITIEDAYIKIESVTADKEYAQANVSMNSAESSLTTSYAFPLSVADDSENFIRQGYEYLKTLPEFAGAVDC